MIHLLTVLFVTCFSVRLSADLNIPNDIRSLTASLTVDALTTEFTSDDALTVWWPAPTLKNDGIRAYNVWIKQHENNECRLRKVHLHCPWCEGDQVLPTPDGLSACQRIHESNQTLPIQSETINVTFTEVESSKNYSVFIIPYTVDRVSLNWSSPVIMESLPYLPYENESVPLIKEATSWNVGDSKTEIAVELPLNEYLCSGVYFMSFKKWGVVIAGTSDANDTQIFEYPRDVEYKINNTYKNWFEVQDTDGTPPYITHEDTYRCYPLPGVFVIGSDGDCSNYKRDEICNGELRPGQTYRVKAFVCSEYGCYETLYSLPITTDRDYTWIIAGSVWAFVGIIIIVLTIVVCCKIKNKACFASNKSQNPIEGTTNGTEIEMEESKQLRFRPEPVKLSEYGNHLRKMHRYGDFMFDEAFRRLNENSIDNARSVAESSACRPKNRTDACLAFDHSRVVLRPIPGVSGSDYINANYIPGWRSAQEYIATQKPMATTINDFWCMVWDQNVDTIVMLNDDEKDVYWPSTNDPVCYGALFVAAKTEINFNDFELLIFEVKLKTECRMIRHFFYRKWPDDTCPSSPRGFVEFVTTVREHRRHEPSTAGPIVVHCFDGSGPTGTYIAVDYLLQGIQTNDAVNIYSVVLGMREYRPSVVQTKEQFMFIHECLRSAISPLSRDSTRDTDEVYFAIQEDDKNVYEKLDESKKERRTYDGLRQDPI